jgi:hypothetical protein
MRRLALASIVLAACGTPVTHIDGRYDAGGVDGGGSMDGGGPSDGGADAFMGSDGGSCTRATPPSPAMWTVPSTGGPAGETVTACLARAPSPSTDDRVPEDQRYDLTTFGGGADTQPTSCGGMMADGTWYYAANAQRFACGQHVRLVDAARTHCVIVQVADVGPNICVEAGAGAPIWDVSPLAAQHLFGGTSYGWSDRVGVIGAPVGSDNALGPCDPQIADPSAFLRGFIGGPCTSAADCGFAGAECRTEAQGFPGGHCTLPCGATSCPDQAGPNAYTGCADLTGMGDDACAARCDYTLFPTTGCRDGYGCYDRPHPTSTTAAHRRVCLPLPCL